MQPIVFARYLVQDILPTTIERAIYLDQDVLVQKDLAPLWEIDLQGFPIAAAREWACTSRFDLELTLLSRRRSLSSDGSCEWSLEAAQSSRASSLTCFALDSGASSS